MRLKGINLRAWRSETFARSHESSLKSDYHRRNLQNCNAARTANRPPPMLPGTGMEILGMQESGAMFEPGPCRTTGFPPMKHFAILPPLDWANRVNHTWLVQGHLKDHAAEWLEYLATRGDERLETSCVIARAMCDLRDPLEDPKPWFYAGLFSLATAAEARRFLAGHRTTSAAVPSMEDDEHVKLWIANVGPKTRVLLDRLRHGLAHLRPHPP